MSLQALSAGTSLTLCGVTPVAAHCSMLEPSGLPHTITVTEVTQTSKIRVKTHFTDLLYTNSGHGGFSGEAGLEVAQDFLHTLSEN